jgi:hypothetical protein
MSSTFDGAQVEDGCIMVMRRRGRMLRDGLRLKIVTIVHVFIVTIL